MGRKIAIVLFNLGGPDNTDNIKPFLRNLFSDRAIIDLPWFLRLPIAFLISTLRAPKAKPLYEIMGGSSPLLKNTILQAEAIEKQVSSLLPDDEVKVFISMRYWKPFAKETAKQVAEFDPDETILLPLYPHYSCTTTGSSLDDWARFSKTKSKTIKNFPLLSGFISGAVNSIIKEWDGLGNPQKVRVLFSAHGLPQKIIDNGDPYEKEINETANAIKEILPPNFETIVCYQSKVGPLKWLGPSTEDEIIRAARDKIGIIIYPIAFVSNHIETLVELDVEYRELAHKLGIEFFARADTINCDKDFINSLSQLIIEKIEMGQK